MTLDDVLEELVATRRRLDTLRRRSTDARGPTAYAWLAAGKPLRAVEGLRDLDDALRRARQWANDNGAPWPPRQPAGQDGVARLRQSLGASNIFSREG